MFLKRKDIRNERQLKWRVSNLIRGKDKTPSATEVSIDLNISIPEAKKILRKVS